MKSNIITKIFLLFIILLQIYIMFLQFKYPLVGIGVRENDNKDWIVHNLDQTSIASKINIKKGDKIVGINEQAPGDYWSVRYWRSIDQFESVKFLRDSTILEVKSRDLQKFEAYDVFALFAVLSSLAISLILYKKTANIKSSRNLSTVFLNIALIFMVLPASVRGDITGKILIGSFMMVLPILFYQFLISFFYERGVTKYPLNQLLPNILIFCVIVVSSIQLIFYFDNPYIYKIYMFMSPITLITGIIGVMINFIILAYIYITTRKSKSNVSTIIKIVFTTLALSLMPIILFSFIPKILFGHEWIDSFYMSWFVFIFPLTFVYLLASRRLYDIDMIMRRLLLTGVISLIPSVLFTALVKLLSSETSLERLVLIFIFMVIGITFVLYSLENLTSRLEPTLFPRKHGLQLALKKIARNLGTISSLREMKEIILVDIIDTLEVMGGAIAYLYRDGSIQMIVEGTLEEQQVENLIAAHDFISDEYMCFEVSRQEEYTSYLVMTRKKTFTMLGMEEVQWLNLIITYLAVSLENIHLIQRLHERMQQMSSLLPDEKEAKNLNWFRKLMFELQEKERVRIATDLHDTTMQDMFFLKGRLQHLQEEYGHTREEKKVFGSLIDYIDIINSSLRQSCFELHPYLLREVGLVGTLNKLFQTERPLCGFQISFITSDKPRIEEQDMEAKRHLFRLVQELLNNAKKHSQATIVRFSIFVQQGNLYFEYMDDGVGFDSSSVTTRDIGASGIGMEQIKSRILSLSGHYDLYSALGEGVRFQAHFPIGMGKHSA